MAVEYSVLVTMTQAVGWRSTIVDGKLTHVQDHATATVSSLNSNTMRIIHDPKSYL